MRNKGPRRTIQVWGVQLDDGTKIDAGDKWVDGRKIVSVYNLGGKDGRGYKMVFGDNSSIVKEANVVLANPRFN
jgi:hypothetical protein